MADPRETTKLNLHNDITVNGETFKAGSNVEVPKNQADDIARMDYDHQQYKGTLHVKRSSTVDAGTIAAGGGTE